MVNVGIKEKFLVNNTGGRRHEILQGVKKLHNYKDVTAKQYIISQIQQETGVPEGTLKLWRKELREKGFAAPAGYVIS